WEDPDTHYRLSIFLVKKWKRDPLTPWWDGPHTVSLISHAAVKLLESDKWTHHTRVKWFSMTKPPEEDTSPLSTPAPETSQAKLQTTGPTSSKHINISLSSRIMYPTF
uniref:Murine leukemia virus integrase C-terminal domain-containing protein n=1 Tax=Chelonoidis abingdonii TaxID=106734 RepID=A0A8C0IT86_CHEAB